MKYIMFRVEFDSMTMLEPVLFSSKLVHSEVAKHMKPMVMRNFPTAKKMVVDSAGEVAFYGNDGLMPVAVCSGRSETLGLESQPERDGRAITMLDYGGNFV